MHESFNEAKLILVISTGLILLLGFIVVAILLINQKRKFSHKQQLTDLQNLSDRTILQSELKVKEEIFKAISQNLHDNIGSNISTAMLLLYKDQAMSPDEFESNRKQALNMMGSIVDDLKHIARSLNQDYLHEIGLDEAIRQRIAQLEKTKRYEIIASLSGSPYKLHTQKQLILFYIFQEAVNNIVTHAKAKSMEISLHYYERELVFSISDDGQGISKIPGHDPTQNKGSGLINMENYAKVIGATLEIQTGMLQGTRIILTVPDPYMPS